MTMKQARVSVPVGFAILVAGALLLTQFARSSAEATDRGPENYSRTASLSERVDLRAPEQAKAMGLDPSSASVVREDERGRFLSLSGRDGQPCYVVELPDGSSGGGCGTRNGGVVSAGTGAGIGIVPDSVKTVVFTLKDGRSVEGRVVNNVWTSPAEATGIRYTVRGVVEQAELTPASQELPAGAQMRSDGFVTSK